MTECGQLSKSCRMTEVTVIKHYFIMMILFPTIKQFGSFKTKVVENVNDSVYMGECEWFRIHGKLEWSGSRSCPCIEYIHWYKQPFMCLQLWCSIDRYGLIIRWSLGKRMWCPSWKKFFWQHCLIQRSSLLLRRMYISVTDKKKSTLVETP